MTRLTPLSPAPPFGVSTEHPITQRLQLEGGEFMENVLVSSQLQGWLNLEESVPGSWMVSAWGLGEKTGAPSWVGVK